MIQTGFYGVAIRKASERKEDMEQELVRRRLRLKELGIEFNDESK